MTQIHSESEFPQLTHLLGIGSLPPPSSQPPTPPSRTPFPALLNIESPLFNHTINPPPPTTYPPPTFHHLPMSLGPDPEPFRPPKYRVPQGRQSTGPRLAEPPRSRRHPMPGPRINRHPQARWGLSPAHLLCFLPAQAAASIGLYLSSRTPPGLGLGPATRPPGHRGQSASRDRLGPFRIPIDHPDSLTHCESHTRPRSPEHPGHMHLAHRPSPIAHRPWATCMAPTFYAMDAREKPSMHSRAAPSSSPRPFRCPAIHGPHRQLPHPK